jgi:hypothetical protein
MRNLLLILSLVTAVTAFGQTTFLSNLNSPNGLAFHHDTLYYAEENTGLIYKVDVTNPTPTPVFVASGTNTPIVLKIFGDELYISEFSDLEITKIDLTDPNPTLKQVVGGSDQLTGIAFRDSFMYYSNITAQAVYKLDLRDTLATPSVCIPGYFGVGMVFEADTLYIISGSTNSITKHDITDSLAPVTTIKSGLNFPGGGGIYNDILYFAESGGNLLSRVGIQPPYTYSWLYSGTTPRRVALHGSYLYASIADDGEIVKFQLNVGINEFSEEHVKLFPNPSKGAVFISSKNVKVLSITNLYGQEVDYSSEAVNQGIKLTLSQETTGMYLVNLINEDGIVETTKVLFD